MGVGVGSLIQGDPDSKNEPGLEIQILKDTKPMSTLLHTYMHVYLF